MHINYSSVRNPLRKKTRTKPLPKVKEKEKEKYLETKETLFQELEEKLISYKRKFQFK